MSMRRTLVIATLACVCGLEPQAGGDKVCVDARGEVTACTPEDVPSAAPMKTLQEQFTDAILHARKLKGLDDETDTPLSLSRRRKASRKAAQAEKREERARAGGGRDDAGAPSPATPAPSFTPGCAPDDTICDRRARQARRREEHARAHGEREVERLARAAEKAAHASTVERYYADADLAAALDADLARADAEAWG